MDDENRSSFWWVFNLLEASLIMGSCPVLGNYSLERRLLMQKCCRV